MGIKSRQIKNNKYKAKPNKPLHKHPVIEPEPPKLNDFKLLNRDNLPLKVQQERHDRPAVLPYDENRYYRNLIEPQLDKENYIRVDNAIGLIEIISSNYQKEYLLAPNLTPDKQEVRTDIIRYLADHNCFFIYARQLKIEQQPIIGGSEIYQDCLSSIPRQMNLQEMKQKRELARRYPFKPVSNSPLEITFYLAKGTEIWQLKQPEMYQLGHDYYVLYGDFNAIPIPVETYLAKRQEICSTEQIPYPQMITRTEDRSKTINPHQQQPNYHHQSTTDNSNEQKAQRRHAKEIINNNESTKNDRQQLMQIRFVGGERNKK